MEKQRGKIGVNTMIIIFVLAIFSPTVRLFGTYTAIAAGQAGWLCPLFAGVVFMYLICKLNTLLIHHPGLSLIEIYEKIVGKFLAKIIAFVYLIWSFILIAANLKFYTMRLSTALYPNTKENLFLIVTLVILAIWIIKSGLVVGARMFKVFHWITIVSFFVISSMLLPNVSIDNLTPISYLDIIPVIEGSVVIIMTWSYITLFLVLSDDIIGIKNFKKYGSRAVFFLVFSVIIMIISMIGTSGSYMITKVTFPYLIAVEQLILLDAVTGIEAILVLLWILSDFALASLLVFSSLRLIKYIFNIKSASIYTNVLMIFIFLITNMIADNYYQLRNFSYDYIVPMTIVLLTIIPILMAWFYKLKTNASKALKASRES